MSRFFIVLLFATVGGAQSLSDAVRTRIAGFQGSVSLYAKNLDSGATFGIREAEPVRTASTIKLAIMAAVFDLVARGQAKWTEPLTVAAAEKVSGTGVIASEISDGVQLPLRDLVHLMIVLSDNTATNMILERITPDAVNAFLDRMGISTTRSLRKIRGDGSDLKAATGWSVAGRLPANQRYGIGVSSPRDMVTLLERIERGELVSPEASREMLAILKRCQDSSGIRRNLGEFSVANKTGSLDALRSDVGIVYTKADRIAMAITVDGMPKADYSLGNAGSLLIADLAKLLVDGLIGPRTKVDNDRIRAMLAIDRRPSEYNRVIIRLAPGDIDPVLSLAAGDRIPGETGKPGQQVVEIELKQPAPAAPAVRDPKLDPIAIDPDHNKLFFENPQVRVFLSTREAGGREIWHEHPGAGRALIPLTDFEAQVETADGKTAPMHAARGDVLWTGGAIKHRATITGSQAARMVVVEVK